MTSDYSIVKCGLQQNTGDFVSVTKYAVILQSGKKYFVPQFYNELNEKLDELSFSITETDENGDVITERTVDFIGLDVNAKTAFGEDRKVMLSDGCCDVKIKVVGGVYGKFVRRKKADETVVDYKKKRKRNLFRREDMRFGKRKKTLCRRIISFRRFKNGDSCDTCSHRCVLRVPFLRKLFQIHRKFVY